MERPVRPLRARHIQGALVASALSPPTGRPALMGFSSTGLVCRERDEGTEIAARTALSPHWRSHMPGHDCGGGQISGGVWQVHVKLDGEHVPGSTFTINVRRANDQELIENAKQGTLNQSATCCDTQHDVTPSTPLPPLFLGTTAASPRQGRTAVLTAHFIALLQTRERAIATRPSPTCSTSASAERARSGSSITTCTRPVSKRWKASRTRPTSSLVCNSVLGHFRLIDQALYRQLEANIFAGRGAAPSACQGIGDFCGRWRRDCSELQLVASALKLGIGRFITHIPS